MPQEQLNKPESQLAGYSAVRRAIIVLGAIQVIIGFILLFLGMLFGYFLWLKLIAPYAIQPAAIRTRSYSYFLDGAVTIYLLMIITLWLGRSSIFLRTYAQKLWLSILSLSLFQLITNLIIFIFLFARTYSISIQLNNRSVFIAEALKKYFLILFIILGLAIIINVVLIAFYANSRVKETFAHTDKARYWTDKTPVSLLIAMLCFVAVMSDLVHRMINPSESYSWIALLPTTKVGIYFIGIAILIYLCWGFYKSIAINRETGVLSVQ